MTLEPTVGDLRAFVRGELKESERRGLLTWMVRCPDPTLPIVLENLQFEWEQEQADRNLPPGGQRLGKLFLQLWEEGRAATDAFGEAVPQAALAVAGTPRGTEPEEGIRLERVGAGDSFVEERTFQVQVFAKPVRKRVAAVAVTDGGLVQALPKLDEIVASFGPVEQRGRTRNFKLDGDDGRVTFWFAAADEPSVFGLVPGTADLLAGWLERLKNTEGCAIAARRLTPRVLTDYYD